MEKDTLPGAENSPGVIALAEDGKQVSAQFETGEGKSRIVDAVFVYTANGSDQLREGAHYEEWFRAPAELGEGVASAVAPPGMTHGVFCLRDENGFLVRSKSVPPWHGPTGNTQWSIATEPDDAFSWRPGLISLTDAAVAARESAVKAGLNITSLDKAIQTANATIRKPVDEASYASAMRALRREIRTLNVPEAKRSVLNLFKTPKW